MANVQVKIDDHLRNAAQAVAASMGIYLAFSVRLFLTQMVSGLPFRPCAEPFYSPRNQGHLANVIDDLNKMGNCATHELIDA